MVPLDGFIDKGEIQVGYNKGALKREILATPANPDTEVPTDDPNNNERQDLWFGNYQRGQIIGFKYEDFDSNGKFDAAIDKPLAGVKMHLTGKTGKSVVVDKTAITDASGIFIFKDLEPSDATGYTVKEHAASDFNGDGTADIDQDLIVTGAGTATEVLTSGEVKDYTIKAADKNIWGNYIRGSIHGVKFHDLNANGTKDANEPFLAGVKFDLFKFMGQFTQKISSGKTVTVYQWEDVGDAESNSHGEFWFTQLLAGTYEVVEQQGQKDPADMKTWNQSTGQPTKSPVAIDKDKMGFWGDAADFLGANPADSKWNFDIISRREFVWELGAQSRPIDGMGGPVDGLIDSKEAQLGYNKGALKNPVLATPTNPDTPNDTTDGNDENQDLWFGDFKNADIIVIKYEDVNNNGKFDAGEPFFKAKFLLTGTDGMGKAVSVTQEVDPANGKTTFSVKPGTYDIVESDKTDSNGDNTPDVQQDLILDTSKLTVTVTSGQTKDFTGGNDKHTFGNYITGSIHGVKFHDLNGDGIWNGRGEVKGEPALPGIKFDLFQWVSKTTTKFVQWKDRRHQQVEGRRRRRVERPRRVLVRRLVARQLPGGRAEE